MLRKTIVIILFLVSSLEVLRAQGDTLNTVDDKGLKQGHWIQKYSNGIIKYDGYFRDDRPVKLMRKYYENGKIKSSFIYYDNDKACAAHIFYKDSVIMARGLYREEKKDSTWTFYNLKGRLVADENYKLGVKHGKSTIYNLAGDIYEQFTWIDGKREGPWLQFFDTGSKKVVGYYVSEKRHGWTTFYNPDGSVSHEGKYLLNVKDSIWNHYDAKGDIEIQQIYKRGHLKNRDEVNAFIERKKLEK